MGVNDTNRKELDAYESCLLKHLEMKGEISAVSPESEPELPFGPFEIEGNFFDGGLQLILLGKNWTSRPIVLNWNKTELNQIPFWRMFGRTEAVKLLNNSAFLAEYTDLRLWMNDVRFSERLRWQEPVLIFYGMGNKCFSPMFFNRWSLHLALTNEKRIQYVLGQGDVRVNAYRLQNSNCSP